MRSAPEDPRTLAEASAWCQDISFPLEENVSLPGLGPFGVGEAYYLAYLTWIRAQIAFGKAQAITSYLAGHLDLTSAAGLANRVIELSLLEAQAWRVEGEEQRARSALERALAAAQPEGYVRIFDQGPTMTRLLVEETRRGIFKEYIERILAAIGVPEALSPEQESLVGRSAQTFYGENLSERELEVLRLMARGASNHEIAEQLVITVGTVKSHINHILVKMESHNRTEAVARARGLGLIEI